MKRLRALQDDVEPPVVQFLDPDQFADAADAVERRLIALLAFAVEHLRLDQCDPPRAGERIADHFLIARLEDVQRDLRAREQDRPGQRKQGHADRGLAAHVNRTAESRRRCAFDHSSRDSRRFHQLQQPRARRPVVPVPVAGDDVEQGVGRPVAVAGAHPRIGQLEPCLMVVGIGREPRLERARVDIGRGAGRHLERGLGPRHRGMLGRFGAKSN